VLDFQRGPRPRNFLSRGEQWRLLLLVLALGLVVILALEARNPQYYRWLLPDADSGAGRAARGDRSGQSVSWKRIGARVRPQVGEGAAPGTSASPPRAEQQEATSSRYFPGVDPGRLSSVSDNKPLWPSEWDAWLHLFDVLERTDEATLERASVGRVTFVQLLGQSKEYRGELVTTSGIIRRAHPAKTPENDYGLVDYYQTWLWPADRPDQPIVVWCLHLPEGFPIGMEIAEEAEVTGFCFKLWAYKAADGSVLRAPMLLARGIRWRKRPEVARTPPKGPLALLLMITGCAAFALVMSVYVHYRTRSRRPSHVESLLEAATLRDTPAPAEVAAALERLADSEHTHGS